MKTTRNRTRYSYSFMSHDSDLLSLCLHNANSGAGALHHFYCLPCYSSQIAHLLQLAPLLAKWICSLSIGILRKLSINYKQFRSFLLTSNSGNTYLFVSNVNREFWESRKIALAKWTKLFWPNSLWFVFQKYARNKNTAANSRVQDTVLSIWFPRSSFSISNSHFSPERKRLLTDIAWWFGTTWTITTRK